MDIQNQAKNLTKKIKTLISNAQENAIKAVDTQRVILYWNIGQRIYVDVQKEEDRAEYGSGYSYRQLYLFLQFYKEFPKVNTLCSQLNWSKRELERQINSSLFERLLLSNDKKSVLEVAKND